MTNTEMTDEQLLQVKNLSVNFSVYGGLVNAVRNVSFNVRRGETLAIVGESGSGKSVTMQAIMGLLDPKVAQIEADSMTFQQQSLLALKPKEFNSIRGAKIGMIFQDPMSALNPLMKVGAQIAEVLQVHERLPFKMAYKRAVVLLDRMGVPNAERRAQQYPFEFSGGMLQRVMIAQSLACKPALLIADEPTTALDVTIQQQVLALIAELQQEVEMSMIIVTHDLGVVAQVADQVAVMYAGQIVEYGTVEDIFYHPAHPYTIGLHRALPDFSEGRPPRLTSISGSPPDLFNLPNGCAFHSRCTHAMSVCSRLAPPVYRSDHLSERQSRCWLHHEMVSEQQSQEVCQLTDQSDSQTTSEHI